MAARPTRRITRKKGSGSRYLDGQLLIAMPGMRDQRFARAVIYMCAHSSDGAMGLIINQRADHISFPELLIQARAVSEDGAKRMRATVRDLPIHVGGPVETGRGFVLHSAEYFAENSTLPIDGAVSLTATIDILKSIAGGKGPTRYLLALGYAGWSGGQLEREIQANGWLSCTADEEIVFDEELESKYERALSKLGVHPTHLVNACGHA